MKLNDLVSQVFVQLVVVDTYASWVVVFNELLLLKHKNLTEYFRKSVDSVNILRHP